jgi:hypothetical protein
MPCIRCGDKRIAHPYRCNVCHVKDKTFIWCVIIDANQEYDPEHDDIMSEDYTNGNICDDLEYC